MSAAKVIAALMLCAAFAAGSESTVVADGTNAQNISSVIQDCRTIIVKIHARHWVWVRKIRKVHGRRVVVRRHGKIVHVHVRVSYLKAEPKRVCTATTLAPTPASQVAAFGPAPSAQTELVTAAPQPPVNTGPPTISGTAQQGQTLSASPGTWANNPTGYSYDWQRCDSAGANCAAIALATSSSYAVVEADVNSTLRVVVVASNGAGLSLPATSLPTAVVTSSTEEGPYRGVNSHAPWYWQVSEAEAKREIAEAAALGVNFIRVPVEWAKIESAGEGVRGGKALTRLDLVVNEAAAHGIKVDGTIATTPHWASPGGAWNDAPLEAEKSLRGFTKWLTERYGTKLVAVGVLNEPSKLENLKSPTGEYLPSTSEEGIKRRAYYYVKDVKAVFNGAREGNAAVKVLVGENGIRETESKSVLFLKSCFEGGLPHGEEKAQTGFKGYYDAFGAHVYSEGAAPESTNRSSTKSKIERLHKLLVEQESPVPIWANEWGYSLEDSETVRAEYVEKGVRMLDTQFPYLEGWAYYQLRDTVNEPLNKEENFGLLHYSFEPRLSFAAFKVGMPADLTAPSTL
jgi:hypothetical protein